MNLYKAIRELYEEKKRLDQVIASLEELQRKPEESTQKRRGRRRMDQQARAEVSSRMKSYRSRMRKKGPENKD